MFPRFMALAIRLVICLCFLHQCGFSAPTDQADTGTQDARDWSFPRLRGIYRSCFRWSHSLSEDKESTETLGQLRAAVAQPESALAIAALVAANDKTTTPLLDQASLEKSRQYALRLLSDQSLTWGPEPLLHAFLSPRNHAMDDYSFAKYLMAQVAEDDVANNAFNSAEIYHTALQEHPSAFLQPLLDRLLEKKQSNRDQEGILLASLLLLHCSTPVQDRTQFKESWFRSAKFLNKVSHTNFFRLTDAQRAGVLQVAETHVTGGYSYWDDVSISAFGHGNRRLSWMLLEDCGASALPHLQRIIFDPNAFDNEKCHALLLWLVIDDHSLNQTQRGREAIAETIAGAGLRGTFGIRWYHDAAEGDETSRQFRTDLLDDILYHPYAEISRVDPGARSEEWRKAWVHAVTLALETEGDERRQMRLAEFLMDCDAEDSNEIITNVSISNLLDDDVYSNGASAASLLNALNPDPESLLAGVRIAMTEGDGQMFAYCAQYLMDQDESFHPQDEPGMLEFATAQLAGASSARISQLKAVLRNSGAAAKPHLLPLLDSEDPYVARSADQLIKDIDYLEALRKRGRKPSYLGSTETVPLYQKEPQYHYLY
ncbi:hypothetical protein IT570_05955 [Candidatus Sumerlaeota bacterium]|nr:hypothetical protein [Candidatus Sumerlaeota bacterium]